MDCRLSIWLLSSAMTVVCSVSSSLGTLLLCSVTGVVVVGLRFRMFDVVVVVYFGG